MEGADDTDGVGAYDDDDDDDDTDTKDTINGLDIEWIGMDDDLFDLSLFHIAPLSIHSYLYYCFYSFVMIDDCCCETQLMCSTFLFILFNYLFLHHFQFGAYYRFFRCRFVSLNLYI